MTLKAKFDYAALKENSVKLTQLGKVEFTQKLADSIGRAVVSRMKDQMNKGISPVNKEGRFFKYKKSYETAIKAGRYPNKGTKPVNLKLTGAFHKSLGFKAQGFINFIEISFNFYGQEDKEDWLRYNPTHAKSRKALPRGNEGFNVVIQKTIKDVVNAFIIKLLKKY